MLQLQLGDSESSFGFQGTASEVEAAFYPQRNQLRKLNYQCQPQQEIVHPHTDWGRSTDDCISTMNFGWSRGLIYVMVRSFQVTDC